MSGAGDDHVVRRGVDVGQRLSVDATVGDRRARSSVGCSRREAVSLEEVGEEVQQYRQLILERATVALVLVVVPAEHLLGQGSMRPKSDSGSPSNDMITYSGKSTAMSVTKSHFGPMSAILST